jgi:CBS domain-containing protein
MQTSVISVRAEQTLGELAEILTLHHISGVPVVDAEGQVKGVVSQSDLARRLAQIQHDQASLGYYHGLLDQSLFSDVHLREVLKDGTVAEILTPYPFWVSPQADLREVIDLMLEHHIHRVPVLDEGRLVGVLSTMDLLRVFRQRL